MRVIGGICAVLLGCGLLVCGVVCANSIQASLAACKGQVRPLHAKTGPQVASVNPGLVCFTGDIDPTSAHALVAAINKVPSGDALTLVIEDSSGGNAASGIDIAEALSHRETTMIAHGICASSCANYLWLMADHRVIADRSLVIFHGGVTLALLPEGDKQLETLAKANPDMDVDAVKQQMHTETREIIRRQDALLKAHGIAPDFFRFFDRVDSPAKADHASADCKAKPQSKYLVLSPAFLKAKGVEIESNQGPKTAAAMNADLKAVAPKLSSQVCFGIETSARTSPA